MMASTRNPLVVIVHSIDTEGPLYESLEATFGRLRDLHGVTGLPQTPDTLALLRQGAIDLGGREQAVAEMLSGHLLSYNDDWAKIDAMLDRIMDPGFRQALPDSFGGGWVFNWHCIDWVDFEVNPRRRAMGYHAIFDHYSERVRRQPDCPDALHFHFHPMSTYREAHRCATSYVNSPHLYQTLARRVIERQWFPTVFRAGFQTERPDSHWFLEQWLPFDISNMAVDNPAEEFDKSIDFRNGRSGDWRRAPADWSVYHPAHDDYQSPGHCRRWIGRCLNVMNRIASIDQREMDKAFSRAQETGQPVLVGITGHDFRDLGREIDHVRALIAESQRRYPEVKFKYCEAVDGFRQAIGGNAPAPLELEMQLQRAPVDDVPNLTITARQGSVFGPQPFLAIETVSRRFIHDNLDFSGQPGCWHYAFHGDTLPLSDVLRIGIAANDAWGNCSVKVLDVNVSDC